MASRNTWRGLKFAEPVKVWDEALPLGNGVLGALVWGDGAPLKISLDRTDLWDLRPVPEYHSEDYTYARMRQWEKEGRVKDLEALYDNPYHRPAPTKIPAARIELFLQNAAFGDTSLDVTTAEAAMSLRNNQKVKVWISATEPVGIIEIENTGEVEVNLVAPAFGGGEHGQTKPAISLGALDQLGYPAPQESAGDGFAAYRQEGWGGFRFAVHLAWRKTGGMWVGVWSIATSDEGGDAAALAASRTEGALNRMDELRRAHLDWWQNWWDAVWIEVPNKAVEHQWYLDTYKFGAAARRDAPPITLQGPWTADNGQLPPWKGDYHHDLNTQLSYWPCYSGNRLEEGLGFLEWLWKNRENNRDWTRRFFGMPGINVPMTADLNNNQIGGWRQYTHSSTTGAWLAHHFYLHWKFSMDRAFLRDRAWPWIRDCAIFLEAVTDERDARGLRTLPLSSSPEIHGNKPEAWFPGITNYDLALIRWLFGAAGELAGELGLADEVARWQLALKGMPELALGEDGRLLVASGHPLMESHRHFSHLMAIHPLGLIDLSMGDAARRTIDGALSELDRLGSSQWCGYSFSWLSNLAARAGKGIRAEKALEIFATAFVLRNGFHCNGDQSGKGLSAYTYRPFTLEGNFAAAAGLQEMLLQSHTGVIHVFPAVPEGWKDIRFHRLRAQGAFVVSAQRQDGMCRYVEVFSETGQAPVIGFGTGGPMWRLGDSPAPRGWRAKREGNTWMLTAGE